MPTEKNIFEDFICGGFGGMCNILVGHPMDTVKVRLQTQRTGPGAPLAFTGTWNCITRTIKNEGPFGLYKGISAPLTTVTPIFALSFFGFGIGKKIFDVNKEDNKDLRVFGAGTFSGFFTAIIMSPGERVKCLLQIQQNSKEKKYNGPFDVLRKLYIEGGIKSIYRGFLATIVRDVPSSGVYFLTYSFLTRVLTPPGEYASMPTTIFAGGMSGITNWLIAMPADTVKSRLQTAPEGSYPHGMSQVFKELVLKGGPTALYRGFTPVVIRAFPANAACFLGFEIAAMRFKIYHQKQ